MSRPWVRGLRWCLRRRRRDKHALLFPTAALPSHAGCPLVPQLPPCAAALLFGMMIIVGRLQDTGMFELMAAWAVRLSRGRMALLSLLLM